MRRENGSNRGNLDSLLPCGDNRTGNRSDHILQESATADSKNPRPIVALPNGIEDGPDPILNFCSRGAERREVVRPQKLLSCAVNQAFIERVAKRIDVPAVK